MLPQPRIGTSEVQQKLDLLNISDIHCLNIMVSELRKLWPATELLCPVQISGATIRTIGDASHSGNSETYDQSGLVSSLKIVN